MDSINHRIIEHPESEATHKDHPRPTSGSTQDHPKSDHMSESIVQALFEIQQAWCRDHDPGEPVPVPDHPLGGEPSPDTQPELPL